MQLNRIEVLSVQSEVSAAVKASRRTYTAFSVTQNRFLARLERVDFVS